MSRFPLHAALRRGDFDALCTQLATGQVSAATLRECNGEVRSLLGLAVSRPEVPVRVVQALLAAGADPDSILHQALRAGDPDKVGLLLAAGAKLDRQALLTAVQGRVIQDDPRLLPLLDLLLAAGARHGYISEYGESALRWLSLHGRFDGVARLLAAGADADELAWAPLHRAVAIGSLDEVRAELSAGVDLEAQDRWDRTPLLVALLAGAVDKAEALRQAGASVDATARGGETALMLALSSSTTATADWLHAHGVDLEQRNHFASTALMEAASAGNARAVQWLLAHGADPNARRLLSHGLPMDGAPELWNTALTHCTDGAVARALLEADADPADLGREARREILGLPGEPDPESLEEVTRAQYDAGWRRIFGRRNPEVDLDPFRLAMIRAGVSGYRGAQHFKAKRRFNSPEPVWSAERYGQSLTPLPDGRWIQIGGEHEDHYDPDFCIYNDVFVHGPDGTIQMFRYPEAVFPPTDFHTATRVGNRIVLIGRLGYHGQRHLGTTPVHVLHLDDFRIEAMPVSGSAPGWIYQHRAVLSADGHRIALSGGQLVTAGSNADGEQHQVWQGRAVLDLQRQCWLPQT